MEKFKNVPKWFRELPKEVAYFREKKLWQATVVVPIRKNTFHTLIQIVHGKTRRETIYKAYREYLKYWNDYRTKYFRE